MDPNGLFSLEDASDNSYGYSGSDDENGRTKTFNRDRAESNSSDSDEDANEAEQDAEAQLMEEDNDDDNDEPVKVKSTVAPLTKEENEKRLKDIKRSGVVYFSSIPPYMKPVKLRQILSKFGDVNRIFLNPESPAAHARRVKSGGNRKKKYTEGWAEFKRKSQARLAADTLNGNKLGGKKGSFYYDDIMNVKYLKNFKWTDLTEQIALEAQERQERLKAEIAQATKENKIFMENVEKKAMLDRIKAQKGSLRSEKKDTDRPKREQKPTQIPKKSSADLDNVLSRVF